MTDNKEELFEKEVKNIDDEPKEEVKEQVKLYTKKGKERQKNKDGTYRKRKPQTPEQRARMLEVLAKGREKAKQVRAMKASLKAEAKQQERTKLEEEYASLIEKKKQKQKEKIDNSEEVKALKDELSQLKQLIKDMASKPKPSIEKEKVSESIPSKPAPVVESVPVEPVKESAPVVVEESVNTLPIPPVIRKKSIRAKSVWSQFV